MSYGSKPRTPTWLSATTGLIILPTFVALIFGAAAQPAPVAVPKKFVSYTAPDKAFRCETPDGWRKTEKSAHGVLSRIKLEKNRAVISVTADLGGSLMGDMVSAQNAQMDGLGSMMGGPSGAAQQQQRPAVEKLHLAARPRLEQKYEEFDEEPMQNLQSTLGEGRVSEWTSKGGSVSGARHGYRVTILSGERLVTVTAYCPENQWKTLQPAFVRVIGSLKPSAGE